MRPTTQIILAMLASLAEESVRLPFFGQPNRHPRHPGIRRPRFDAATASGSRRARQNCFWTARKMKNALIA